MRPAAEAAPGFVLVPELAGAGERVVLRGDEAHYLSRVVRARETERLTATDGAGCVARLVVESLKPEIVLHVEAREHRAAPPASELLCGAPEGERGDWLIEKCAELGVTRFIPVDCARAAWPTADRTERWQRLAVAALKQSRSAWLMRCEAGVPLEEAVAGLAPSTRWLADAGGTGAERCAAVGEDAVAGIVGPASGFSGPERNVLLENGFVSVRLAPTRLRTETAAVALAALWAAGRSHLAPPAA
jgi:16S rRNA (uracil1498-N3)-methyltransferase